MNSSKRTTGLLADYDRMVHTVRMKLLEYYPSKVVWEVLAETRQELERLIPRIPDLGPGHVWQFNLDACAMELALYRTLKKWGFTLPEAVQFAYDVLDIYLQNIPRLSRLAYRWYHLSRFHRSKLRRAAAASQRRQYPQDWVFTYVQGDGGAFGVDVTECAICKLFRTQRAEELVPYLCALDFAMGKRFDLGFTRNGTLAEGASVCDCRWKRGAETRGWPVVGPERSRLQTIGGDFQS